MMRTTGSNNGFTLIELMIVVVIAAILAAVGIPAYRRYIVASHRADGRALLERASADEQRFFTLYSTYTTTVVPSSSGCSGQACGLDYASADSGNGYYTLSITPGVSGIADSYILEATPTSKGGQNEDTECGSLTLDSTGKRGFTGTGMLEECWPG